MLRKISAVLVSLFLIGLLFLNVSLTDDLIVAGSDTEPTEPFIFKSLSAMVQIDPGEEFHLYFDPNEFELNEKTPFDLPDECDSALELVPDWLKRNLSYKFRQLSPEFRNTYANLILNSPDKRYIDEIAFCIAHSAVENLQHDYMFPELFTHNAQHIYSSSEFLKYVEIIEKENYTTVIYEDKNSVEVELPKDLYYWYIVHPKLSDELPTYVDPDYDFTTQPPFSRNYGVPPPTGKFWRDWLFYHNDTSSDYDGPAKKNPLLKDLLSEPETLWEAISTCNNWMSNSMSFTSDQERPIQPVRIYRKHIGRCGEYQDMRNAIARAGLMPSTCTLNSAEDHVWNEFWDGRWIHWDGSIDKPNSYDNDLGGYFHKDLSSVFNTRGDSHIWPVTPRYTPVCDFTATVLDASGEPADGALVTITTENYYNSELRSTSIWGTTDYSGKLTLPLGNLRNYWCAIETDDLGNEPLYGSTQIIENSSKGAKYEETFTLPRSAPALNLRELTAPIISDPKYKLEIEYEVVGNILRTENAYTGEHGDVFSKSGNVDFFITDSQNFDLYSNNLYFNAYDFAKRSPAGKLRFVLPTDDRYYAVFSNEFSLASTKLVKINVNLISDIKIDIISPENGDNLEIDYPIRITGSAWGAAGINRVELRIDDIGQWEAATDTAGTNDRPYSSWEYDFDTSELLPGPHTIRARAFSEQMSNSTSINISLYDRSIPNLVIESPEDNSLIELDKTIIIEGTVTDNVELSSLKLLLDPDGINTINITSFIDDDRIFYKLRTSVLGEGDHTLMITATDTSKNSVTETRYIRIQELIKPEVIINNPISGSIFKLGDSVKLNGLASDNRKIISLELMLDSSSKIGIMSSLNEDGSWFYNWDTGSISSFEGLHTISINATDDSGNFDFEETQIVLDGTAPEIQIEVPTEKPIINACESYFCSGTVFDAYGIEKLEFRIDDSAPIGITEKMGSGTWGYEFEDTTELASGEHTVVVSATDYAGFKTEDSMSIIIDAQDPFIDISIIKDTYIIGETILLTGRVTDDIGIMNVLLIIDNEAPIDITDSITEFEWNYRLNTVDYSTGSHKIKVIVTDQLDNSGVDEMKIKLKNEPAGTSSGEDYSKTTLFNLPITAEFILLIIILIIIIFAVVLFVNIRK